MKKSVFLLIVVLFIISNVNSFGIVLYNDFDEVFLDARSASIGNTTLLTTNGSNSLFTNPALLADDYNLDVKLTGRGRYKNYKYKYDNVFVKPTSEIQEMDFRFGSVALSKAIKCENFDIGFGIGINKMKDYFASVKDGLKAKGSLNMIALGVGIDYQDMISFGIAYNKSIESEIIDGSEIDGKELDANYLLYSINLHFEDFRFAFSFHDDYELTPKDNDIEWAGVKYPQQFKMGLSYKLDSSLSLYAEYHNWTISDYAILESNLLFYDKVDAMHNFGFGVEYSKLHNYRFGLFRKGVSDIDLSSGKIIYEYGYTLGYGLEIIDNVTLDTYFQNSFLNGKIKYASITGLNDSYTELENVHFNFGVTLGYKFKI